MALYLVDENMPILPFWNDEDFIHSALLDFFSDTDIWRYALENRLVIINKDSDFYYRYLTAKKHPQVVWIRTGNLLKSQLNLFIESVWPKILEMLENNMFLIVTEEKH